MKNWKSQQSKLKESLDYLKKHGRPLVYKNGVYYRVLCTEYIPMTPREIINYAKHYFHKHNGDLKECENSGDRAAVREKIFHEKFDEIPNKQRVYYDNPWNWD